MREAFSLDQIFCFFSSLHYYFSLIIFNFQFLFKLWNELEPTFSLRSLSKGCPGGKAVQNPPTRAGDLGSIPDPGRPHTLRRNEARVPQLLSPSPTATTEAHGPGSQAAQQETPLQAAALTPQLESGARSAHLEKSLCSNEDPAQPNINK